MEAHEPKRLLVFEAGARIELVATEDAHLLLIGGERLEAAKQEWRTFDPARGTARFPQVPGETEFIPLP